MSRFDGFATDVKELVKLKRVQKTARKLTQADAADARRLIAEVFKTFDLKPSPELMNRIKSGLDYVTVNGEDRALIVDFNDALAKRFGEKARVYGVSTGFVTGKLVDVDAQHIADCARLHGFDDIAREAEKKNLDDETRVSLVKAYKNRVDSFLRHVFHVYFSGKPSQTNRKRLAYTVAGCKLTRRSGEADHVFPEYGEKTSNTDTYAIFPTLISDTVAAYQKEREETAKQREAKKTAKKTAKNTASKSKATSKVTTK